MQLPTANQTANKYEIRIDMVVVVDIKAIQGTISLYLFIRAQIARTPTLSPSLCRMIKYNPNRVFCFAIFVYYFSPPVVMSYAHSFALPSAIRISPHQRPMHVQIYFASIFSATFSVIL